MNAISEDEALRDVFEKYDPYIEKIRAFFVPSLEPRIYSCLETFVYGNGEKGESNEPVRLERDLEMAENQRESFEAFCDNWANRGLFDNIFSQAITRLIKDGLIDCFLNSIIHNNRLNKIGRDLDGLGVRRDFLRYLTAWNYINERGYWIESNEQITMPISNEPFDHQSDLEVEIGSEILDESKKERLKKPLKRRRTRDPSEELDNVEIISKDDLDNLSMTPFGNWPSIASNVQVETTSNEGQRKKSISRCMSCRASTCPNYKSKNYRLGDWEGKYLKLKISEPNYDASKNLTFTKLRLPSEVEDLTAKFLQDDRICLNRFSKSRRKKFQAGMANVCHFINKIMRKMDKNEIRRCRLICEIFPGHLNFKIIRRQSNGCKICLFNDRVPTNKCEERSRIHSRESSLGQFSHILENEISPSTINEKFHPKPNDGKIKPNDEIKELIAKDYSTVNGIADETCRCNDSSDHQNFSDEKKNEKNNLADSTAELGGEKPKQLIQEKFSISMKELSLEGDCTCNRFLNPLPEENEKNYSEMKIEENEAKTVPEKNPSMHSIGIDPDNHICLCEKSCDNIFDVLNNLNEEKSQTIQEKSSKRLITENEENQMCLCDSSVEIFNNISTQDSVKIEMNSAINLDEGICKENRKNISSGLKELKKENDCKFDSDLKLSEPQNDLGVNEICSSSSSDKSLFEPVNDSDLKNLCECPSDCHCENKKIPTIDSKISQISSPSKIVEIKKSSELEKKNSQKFNTQENLWKSKIPLRNSPTKIIKQSSIPCQEPTNQVQKTDKNLKEPKKLKEKSPIISARLGGLRNQRINISIEVCPGSETSMEKIKREPRNVANYRKNKKIENFKMSSSEKRRCHSADREVTEKNAIAHSSVEALECRENSVQDAPSLRNPNMCENPIKSDLRSATKFERRSMSRAGRNVRAYEAGEFSRPIRNNKPEERSKCGKSRRETSPGVNSGFPRSFIGGNIYQAFSASSVRMRHLIKTKLRRILLERDKSTNTSKMILTNKKYRFSVPTGKTERSPFSRQSCRTIWETQSASVSDRTSRSFASENRAEIRETREICQLLYNSSKRLNNSPSHYEGISEGSEYSGNNYTLESTDKFKSQKRQEQNSKKTKNSRLCGGSDNPAEKKFDCEGFSFPKRREFTEKNSNRDVHEIFRNDVKNLDSSGKLDSSLNSTSRHIHFHDFEDCDSSTEELSEISSCLRKENEKLKKNYFTEIQDQINKKGLNLSDVYCKKIHDSRSQRLKSKAEDTFSKFSESKNLRETSNSYQGFNHLDDELRSKLSQYVDLCKSVKYSLLNRIRPEVSGLSISEDQKNF